VVVEDLESGKVSEMNPAAVFIFIGLDPNTAFLKESIDVNEMGFIKTSPTFETSVSGVFATGDVREGSTKQVASAVGEGATVALMVRQYLENSQSGRGSSGA
jgi:thioredoxin reductase (NADPH)